MTKQIIYNTEQEANDALALIEAEVNHLHCEMTTAYSEVTKHPTDEIWSIHIDQVGKYWEVVDAYLTANSLTPVEIAEDWVRTLDEIL